MASKISLQIYNCDESGIPLKHKLPKIVAPQGMKKVRQCIFGTKTQIAILACASAAGQTIPLIMVLVGKNHNNALSKEKFQKPFTECHSLVGWTKRCFQCGSHLKHTVPTRPLLLLLVGHSSHYTLKLIKSAESRKL